MQTIRKLKNKKNAIMNIKTLFFGIVIMSTTLSSFCQNSNNTVKKLKNVTHYTYPICKKGETKKCFGFGKGEYEDVTGPDGKISGLCIIDSVLYVTDSFTKKISKINLKNGKILKTSKEFDLECLSTLNEIIYYKNKIFVLSNSMGFYYEINKDLEIIKTVKHPFYRIDAVYFFFFNNSIYIINSISKSIHGKPGYNNYLICNIDDDCLKVDSAKILRFVFWDTILVYGKPVKMYDSLGICYFETDSIKYEIPELLPQFDYYNRSLGYNEHYLVYVVRHESLYEFIVCEY